MFIVIYLTYLPKKKVIEGVNKKVTPPKFFLLGKHTSILARVMPRSVTINKYIIILKFHNLFCHVLYFLSKEIENFTT